MQKDDLRFYEDEFFYTDSTVFKVFDFELVEGNAATALDAPFSLVLTEKAAKKAGLRFPIVLKKGKWITACTEKF